MLRPTGMDKAADVVVERKLDGCNGHRYEHRDTICVEVIGRGAGGLGGVIS